MKKLLFLAMLVTLFTACNSDDNNNEPFVPQEMEFETILQGDGASNIAQQETIIYNQSELENLMGNNLHPNLENFDFESYQMIAIFGVVSGHFDYYEINNITEYENEIIVQYAHFHSVEGGGFGVFYQPWIIVKMLKSDKTVTFDVEIIEYEP